MDVADDDAGRLLSTIHRSRSVDVAYVYYPYGRPSRVDYAGNVNIGYET